MALAERTADVMAVHILASGHGFVPWTARFATPRVATRTALNAGDTVGLDVLRH